MCVNNVHMHGDIILPCGAFYNVYLDDSSHIEPQPQTNPSFQATGLGVYYGIRDFLEYQEVQQKTGLSV